MSKENAPIIRQRLGNLTITTDSPPRMQQFRYIPGFDGLRCIAVLSVLLLHGSYGRIKGGWVGVDLFFVLSGYLITSLLQHEYQISGRILLKDFYTRRALRLLPPLLVCLTIGNIVWPYACTDPHSDRSVATLSGLLYLADCVAGNLLGPFSHLWSLSVEEHFYFLWPILVSTLLFKASFRLRALLMGMLLAFSMTSRVIMFYVNSHTDLTYGVFSLSFYRFTPCRMDAILMGSGLALAWSRMGFLSRPHRHTSVVVFVLLSALLGIIFFGGIPENPFWGNGGFLLTHLLCLALVGIAAVSPNQPLLSHPLLRWVGRRSYGIYMYHMPVFLALETLRREHSTVNLVFVTALRFVISLVIAELSFRFVEQPILQYKNRLQVTRKTKPNNSRLSAHVQPAG